VLQLEDRGRRFVAQDFNRVLVCQIVRAFHRVERVVFPAVVLSPRGIAQRRIDASLGGDGMGAKWVDFREYRDVAAGSVGRNRCAQAGEPATDDNYVVSVNRQAPSGRPGSGRGRQRIRTARLEADQQHLSIVL
jgi:hypothetical protein